MFYHCLDASVMKACALLTGLNAYAQKYNRNIFNFFFFHSFFLPLEKRYTVYFITPRRIRFETREIIA